MSDLMCRKGEQVKFKFFAMLINFKACCFHGGETISKFVLCRFGGENHLKAAIALLVNKQSATFPLREKSGFSPPNPYTPWLGEHLQPRKKGKVEY